MHIIKTTASIPTKFCTAIKTTKCPSWVVRTHANKSKMADGRHLEKSKNRHIGHVLTDFDQIWHGDTVQHFWAVRPFKNLTFEKSKMAAAAILKNRKLAICPRRMDLATKFDTLTQFDPLDHSVSKIGPSSYTFWLLYALDVSCSFSKTFAV